MAVVVIMYFLLLKSVTKSVKLLLTAEVIGLIIYSVILGPLQSLKSEFFFSLVYFSGMHKKSKVCDPVAKVTEAETKLKENHQHLFPSSVFLAGDSRFKLRDLKPNGGWGDIRDHRLCEHYFNMTASR